MILICGRKRLILTIDAGSWKKVVLIKKKKMYTKVLVVMWENGLTLNFVERRRKQLLPVRKKQKMIKINKW